MPNTRLTWLRASNSKEFNWGLCRTFERKYVSRSLKLKQTKQIDCVAIDRSFSRAFPQSTSFCLLRGAIQSQLSKFMSVCNWATTTRSSTSFLLLLQLHFWLLRQLRIHSPSEQPLASSLRRNSKLKKLSHCPIDSLEGNARGMRYGNGNNS